MEYLVETIYDENDFIGFMDAYTGKDKRLKRMERISRISLKAAGIVLVLAAVVNLMGIAYARREGLGGIDMSLKTVALQAAMLVGGAVMMFFPVEKMSGKRAWRLYQGQGTRITFAFYPDRYTETRQGNERLLKYEVMDSIYEDTYRYYLFVTYGEAHMIPKSCFKKGDPDSFRDFIAEKTGIEVKRV